MISIHIDSGADAADYSDIAKQEKLKPIEIELRKLEKDMDDIVKEMEYLKEREAKMRDTNGTCILGRGGDGIAGKHGSPRDRIDE